jgi:TRAP transporter TAXI family solute receptor
MNRLRHTLLSLRDMFATAGPLVVLAVALLALAYWLLDPTPPSRMTLATGPAQGAYAEFGERYARALKRRGIQVVLKPSQGSAENLKMLQSGEADAAFVQGGSDRQRQPDEPAPEGFLSLGDLFLEPVWLFYREDAVRMRTGKPQLERMSQLQGWRINVGNEGSGVTNLTLRLLESNALDTQSVALSRLEPTPAVMALLDKQLDAIVFVSAPESPLVQMLLLTPGIRLLDFVHAEAYSRRVPSVTPVTLPRGVVDLARDLPGSDVRLVAPTASLVVNERTHPALQQLLVQAAHDIHGQPGWFQRKGEFPAPRSGEYPLSGEAQRFYRSGPPMLQTYLPFWLANLIDRMWVVLVSIIAVLIPLSRIVPPLYEFRIRSRIFRWYAQLRQIELRLAEPDAPAAELTEDLDTLDAKVQRLPVPLSHADELYTLRSHIQLVRRRLGPAAAAAPEPPTP